MPLTNYPGGISLGGTAIMQGTTNVTGAGTVFTGLSSVTSVNAWLRDVPAGTAGGTAICAYGTAVSGGTAGGIILRTRQSDFATAGTVSQAVSWVAYGAE